MNLRSGLLVCLFVLAAAASSGCDSVSSASGSPASPTNPGSSASPVSAAPMQVTAGQTSVPAATMPTPKPQDDPLQLQQVNMINPTFGWAVDTRGRILQTQSGGKDWSDVFPEAKGALFPFFLNERMAWVYNVTDQTVYRTINGGETWLRGETLKPTIVHDGGLDMYFLDQDHGWLELMSGGHGQAGELFRTDNGGKSWTTVSKTAGIGGTTNQQGVSSASLQNGPLPFGGTITFVDGNNGWMARGTDEWKDYPNQLWLFRTSDGGATWSHRDLPIPEPYKDKWKIISPPQWFGAKKGVLPVIARTNEEEVGFVFATDDGGATWSRTPPLPKEIGKWMRIRFMDSEHGWAWGGEKNNTFYRTSDGGNHWTLVTADVTFSYSDRIAFVNPLKGTLLRYDNSTYHLYTTENGGITWTQLEPKLIK